MKTDLTARQTEVLAYIEAYRTEQGYSPTLREIGDHFGLNSSNGVNDHLVALERKGYIRRASKAARSIVLLPSAGSDLAKRTEEAATAVCVALEHANIVGGAVANLLRMKQLVAKALAGHIR